MMESLAKGLTTQPCFASGSVGYCETRSAGDPAACLCRSRLDVPCDAQGTLCSHEKAHRSVPAGRYAWSGLEPTDTLNPDPKPLTLKVYESLRRSEEFPKEKLEHFDTEGAEDLLYEMRNLGVSMRPATAEYIVDNDLDPFVSSGRRVAYVQCHALDQIEIPSHPERHGLTVSWI